MDSDIITGGLTILQVVQTIAQSSAALYEYDAAVHHADSSRQSLIDEFSSISGVLPTVIGIEHDPSLPTPLHRAIPTLMEIVLLKNFRQT